MRAWAQVKVNDNATAGKKPHPRAGQAGVTTAQTPDDATEIEVRFDLDQEAVTIKATDLTVLGG